jgi:hypothetical protein
MQSIYIYITGAFIIHSCRKLLDKLPKARAASFIVSMSHYVDQLEEAGLELGLLDILDEFSMASLLDSVQSNLVSKKLATVAETLMFRQEVMKAWTIEKTTASQSEASNGDNHRSNGLSLGMY